MAIASLWSKAWVIVPMKESATPMMTSIKTIKRSPQPEVSNPPQEKPLFFRVNKVAPEGSKQRASDKYGSEPPFQARWWPGDGRSMCR
jgi:hypothetical protein